MSSIRIAWQGVMTALDDQSDQQRELSAQIAALRGVRSQSGNCSPGLDAIFRSLDRVIERLIDDWAHMRALETGLSSVLNAYSEYEAKIAEGMGGTAITEEAAGESGAAVSTETDSRKDGLLTWEDFWELVSQGGLIGTIASVIGGIATGGLSGSSLTGAAGKILAAVGGVSSQIGDDANIKWKDALWGLGNDLDDIVGNGTTGEVFTSVWKKELADDLTFSSTKAAGDNVAAAAKWGGYVLTGVSNLLEYLVEFEGADGAGGRIAAETAIETGVAIARGAAATAAVAAGAAAIGVTAAPAVVVGAAAVGVVWAANGVCEWITGGKDVGEVVADAVCDGAAALKDGFDAVVSWGKSLFS